MNLMNSKKTKIDILAKLDASTPGTTKHRAKLLAGLLLCILGFLLVILTVVLVKDPPNDPKSKNYSFLIIGFFIFFVAAYVINRFGGYYFSAGLITACAATAPWISLAIDPAIMQGDIAPIYYATISVLLSSILLPLTITSVLALLQFGGLTYLLLFSPSHPSVNWASLLGYVLLVSTLSILSNYINQQYLKRIVDQADQLALQKEQLKEQAVRDYLTNLFNRRYLAETLEREIHRAKRKQVSLGLILLDIDQFKNINDSLGHAEGDILLQELSKLLSELVRREDIVCRYGGDEFILVLPEATQDVAKERAENLREMISRYRLESKNQIIEHFTISVGVAVFPDHGSTDEEIIKAADAALYQAKSEGCNRVVVANK